MTESIDISRGAYVKAGDATYHLTTKGETVVVRLVEVNRIGTPHLLLTMPAGNVAEVSPSETGSRP